MKRQRSLLIALFMALLPATSAQAREFYIVTDMVGAEPSASLPITDVREVFLGQKLFLGENRRVYGVLSRLSDASLDSFFEEVVGFQKDQYAAHWRRKLFAGKGHPPKEFATDEQAIGHVLANHNAIAVVSQLPRTTEAKGLRVLRADLQRAAFVAINPGP